VLIQKAWAQLTIAILLALLATGFAKSNMHIAA